MYNSLWVFENPALVILCQEAIIFSLFTHRTATFELYRLRGIEAHFLNKIPSNYILRILEAMRLLKRNEENGFNLTEDLTTNIPPYAILSHTWGPDADEVTYKDVIDGAGKDKAGYKKLEFCAEQARHHKLKHFWVDTCCVDKSDSIEVQRSINSLFRWYRDATRCYVYLRDVNSACTQEGKNEQSETRWKPALRASKWFTRGWTLQELIAPASVIFFSRDGEELGTKVSLEQAIHDVTGIPINALRHYPLSSFSIPKHGLALSPIQEYAIALVRIFHRGCSTLSPAVEVHQEARFGTAGIVPERLRSGELPIGTRPVV